MSNHANHYRRDANLNAADFERWLALQAAMGYTVTTPEAVEKIRAALAKGSTLTQPVRESAL